MTEPQPPRLPQSRGQKARYMILRQKQKEARVLIAAAPGLLDQLDEIDRERGGGCREMILQARADIAQLMKRGDLEVIERESLILIGLRNVCELLNAQRPYQAARLEIVAQYDPLDTHYGPARAAIAFDLMRQTYAVQFDGQDGVSAAMDRFRKGD
jgi:hypothetical protein